MGVKLKDFCVLKSNLNLVILDDDKVQRYAVKRQLACSKYKFNIFEAERGESAIKILKNHPIHCIIVDYYLPQYDGLAFIEIVKERFGTCPPFLFITSQGSEEVARQAFKKGCFDYISKDKINTDELLTAVLALAEYSHSKVELTDKIENIELLAAEVTHDLNSPLRSMSYSINQLSEDSTIVRSDHIKSHITNIKSNIFNIGNILSDISNSFASKESYFQNTLIDFNDLMGEVVESITHAFPQKTINFSVSPLPLLKGDKFGLFRIFYNLVSNGIKYNDKEVIHINIFHRKSTLYNEIVIEDNGIGISNDNIKEIFKPFYRLNNLGSVTGTGLGLAICKKIIDQHNGKIFVDSVEGEGSKFTIALPLNR
jgi:signal transduction histidine kinase